MNYLASLILLAVEMDQPLAFTILSKLMEDEYFKLEDLYGGSNPIPMKKVFDISDQIVGWLHGKEPALGLHF